MEDYRLLVLYQNDLRLNSKVIYQETGKVGLNDFKWEINLLDNSPIRRFEMILFVERIGCDQVKVLKSRYDGKRMQEQLNLYYKGDFQTIKSLHTKSC